MYAGKKARTFSAWSIVSLERMIVLTVGYLECCQAFGDANSHACGNGVQHTLQRIVHVTTHQVSMELLDSVMDGPALTFFGQGVENDHTIVMDSHKPFIIASCFFIPQILTGVMQDVREVPDVVGNLHPRILVRLMKEHQLLDLILHAIETADTTRVFSDVIRVHDGVQLICSHQGAILVLARRFSNEIDFVVVTDLHDQGAAVVELSWNAAHSLL